MLIQTFYAENFLLFALCYYSSGNLFAIHIVSAFLLSLEPFSPFNRDFFTPQQI